MKLKQLILAGYFFCSATYAVEPNPCVVVGSSVEIPVFNFMVESMGIKKADILESKTKLELLENTLLTPVYSNYLAEKSKAEAKDSWLSLKDYREIFSDGNPRNLVIKYTYENIHGKHNIFIGSAIVNDDECSIDFNGQIIVQREF
ncbi:hypothetical protein [Rouxiella sp. Mn2063]|uniref:hypothetical protein n=1 Tax=Rouxiella sp. Mn2063 TaxID=3395262 RepID=UPI003BC5D507